jgi:hypothetical protein
MKTIGQDPITIDWPAVDWTTSTDFEKLVDGIKWFWPHVKIKWETKERGDLVHIIPIEYRLPTEKEIDAFYPGLKSWNFTNIKMIFYEEAFSNGQKKLNYCAPYRFFSDFKQEEE